MITQKEIFIIKNKFYEFIRMFFNQKEYTEIHTPILVKTPGAEVHLEYFKTHWLDYKKTADPLWLRSSPEIHMKIALCNSMDKIYQIGKCFRNFGEFSRWHNPEFSMLEWYDTTQSYKELMEQTKILVKESHGYLKNHFPNHIKDRDFTSWHEFSLEEAFLEFAGLKLVDNDPELAKQAKAQGIISITPTDDFETAFFKVLLERIEPKLEQLNNVVLYDYPASQCALAKTENGVAKRFEMYLSGVELCNAFWELLGYEENKKRLEEINTLRSQLGKDPFLENEPFLQAMKSAPEHCVGNALGLDRLFTILLGFDDIHKTL